MPALRAGKKISRHIKFCSNDALLPDSTPPPIGHFGANSDPETDPTEGEASNKLHHICIYESIHTHIIWWECGFFSLKTKY